MSTQIASITGTTEGYLNNLDITSFYGGNKRGKCIQLTTDYDHVQLEKDEVAELVRVLSDWLKYIK